MSAHIQLLQQEIESYRQEIIHHKVYKSIENIDDLNIFMEHHLFAVWDFMSLLKALQHNLTCVDVPWFPKGDAVTRHLINEIVVGEESDVDPQGNYMSHFELYIKAMEQSEATTEVFQNFRNAIEIGCSVEDALKVANAPKTVADFVNFTFSTISSNKAYLLAAVFTFGREDLIPNMFLSIIKDINQANPEHTGLFKYYLERHIELDGDHHSHLALEMTANLCGDDEGKWIEVTQASIECLKQRKFLWDGIYNAIVASKN